MINYFKILCLLSKYIVKYNVYSCCKWICNIVICLYLFNDYIQIIIVNKDKKKFSIL